MTFFMTGLKRVNWRWVAFGLLAYVAFLVLSFPAERVYAYWKSGAPAGFALAGITGSVWEGRADAAVIGGQRLEAVSWHLHPWALLTGRVAADWSFKVDDGFGRGEAAAGLGGGLTLNSVEAKLPIAQAPGRTLAALRPSGVLNLNLRGVEWDGTALVSAEGRMVWSGAGINVLQDLVLGDLSLDLETAGGEVKGVLADAGGPLQASGLLTLKADGSYEFTGSFAARGNDPKLLQALRTLGRVGPDGKVQVTQKGTMASLGLVPNAGKS
jgi:general secretion pathway protein N